MSGLVSCGDHQAKALSKLAGKGYSLSVAEFVRASREGDAQAVKWFVEAGVEPSLADADGRTGLSEAVAAGKLSSVEALVSLGVKLPNTGEPAAELLRAAVRAHCVEVLRFLLDHQVTGNGIAKDAVSPLTVAAGIGQRDAVELLLPQCAGAEQEALYAAASNGDVAVLSLIIRSGVNLMLSQAETGKTALMLASAAGNDSAVEMLFNSGANRWTLDQDGKSAFDLAVESGHAKCAALLEVEPTAFERELGAIKGSAAPGQAKILDGAVMPLNPGWGTDLSTLLVYRGCREETLPFLLTSAEEGKATFALLPSGKSQTVELKGAVDGSDWFLSRVEASEGKARASMRHSISGRRLAMVPGVPARAGNLVAVFEFGPVKDLYEGQPKDRFVIKGPKDQQYEVDAVSPKNVILHDVAHPAQQLEIAVGGSR